MDEKIKSIIEEKEEHLSILITTLNLYLYKGTTVYADSILDQITLARESLDDLQKLILENERNKKQK